eukprot:9174405-Pyramimonas_sp.AAC.1
MGRQERPPDEGHEHQVLGRNVHAEAVARRPLPVVRRRRVGQGSGVRVRVRRRLRPLRPGRGGVRARAPDVGDVEVQCAIPDFVQRSRGHQVPLPVH